MKRVTVRKPNGDVNWTVVGPGIVAALAALGTGSGAIGGQVVNAQVSELKVQVCALKEADTDKEARLRILEAAIVNLSSGQASIGRGVELLLSAHQLRESAGDK